MPRRPDMQTLVKRILTPQPQDLARMMVDVPEEMTALDVEKVLDELVKKKAAVRVGDGWARAGALRS